MLDCVYIFCGVIWRVGVCVLCVCALLVWMQCIRAVSTSVTVVEITGTGSYVTVCVCACVCVRMCALLCTRMRVFVMCACVCVREFVWVVRRISLSDVHVHLFHVTAFVYCVCGIWGDVRFVMWIDLPCPQHNMQTTNAVT